MGSPSFELDEEHRVFREVCQSFVAMKVKPLVEQAERSRTFPSSLWSEMALAGLLGLGHPEELGGTGGGMLALAVLSEELARACGGIAITPLVSSYMAAPHIARFGDDAQRATYLAPVLRGEKVAAIAVTEPGAGSDVAGMITSAKRVDGGFTISGGKTFITNAGLADILIVAARTSPATASRHDGISTFLVQAGEQGLSLGAPLEKMGWHCSDTREVFFDECFVPDGRLLGEQGRGFQQIMQAFQGERIVLAGMGVGLAAEAVEQAAEHAKQRQAFGRSISKLQAVSHRLASMSASVQAARLITYQAASRLEQGHPQAAESVAVAKLLAARVACEVVDDAVQIFGGYGFIEESPIAMHYRDARVLRIGGGTDEVQLEIISKRMGL